MKATLVILVAALSLASSSEGAGDPASHCTGAKLKAAAVKASAKLRCHAKATARSVPVDPECLAKAEQKFSAAWARILSKGGCLSTTDESLVESTVDACVEDVRAAIQPCGEVNGVCGGVCPQFMNCFAIGVGCHGEPEPCRCHGSTTTCPPPTTTSTTLP
jgi:hypothetical protein